jgi:hypothetical protein
MFSSLAHVFPCRRGLAEARGGRALRRVQRAMDGAPSQVQNGIVVLTMPFCYSMDAATRRPLYFLEDDTASTP